MPSGKTGPAKARKPVKATKAAKRSGLTPEQRKKKAVDGALDALAHGRSLLSFCKAEDLAYPTMRLWLTEDETVNSAYARAKEDGTHYLADESLEIVDGLLADIQRAQLQFVEQCRDALADISGEAAKKVEETASKLVDPDTLIKIAKLKIERRDRLAGKWNQKDYGERQQLSGDPENPIAIVTQVRRTIVKPGA